MASVRKRILGNGVEVWICDYFDQAGKRHQKAFPNRKSAVAWKTVALHQVMEGTHSTGNITVAEAAAAWLGFAEGEGLERSTIDMYKQHVRDHIVPRLGREKLRKITARASIYFGTSW